MWQLIEQNLFKAKSNRVYIIPTMSGIKLFIVNIIMLAMGLVYSNNFLLLFNFILFSFFIITMFYTHFNLSNLTLDRIEIDDVFLGEKSQVYLHFKTENNEPRYTIKTTVLFDDYFTSSAENIDKNGELITNIVPIKRGKFKLNKIALSTTFPFNLFQSFISFDLDKIVHVFPEIVHVDHQSFHQEQNLSNSNLNIEIKKYEPGENPSRIIWRKSFGDNLVSKYMSAGEQDNILLDIRNLKLTELELSKITSFVLNNYRDHKQIKILTNQESYFIESEKPQSLKSFLNYMAVYE